MKKIILLMILMLLIALTGCVSNQDDELHDHSVEIEGKEMKLLTVQQIADLWEIDSETLLLKITEEFDLKENYTMNTVLDVIREEYPFSPAMIKNIAEEIKQPGIQNE